MAKYLNDWSSDGETRMLGDFRVGPDVLEGAEVLVASYTYEDYSGDAYVLFRKGGELFEVHGGHCSCYGLEGQWEPEAVTKEAILHRLEKGTWGAKSAAAPFVREALLGPEQG